MRSVLVGSDLGPRSDAVVRGAAALALGSGAALHVVHALGLIGMPLREAFTALQDGVDRRARRALQEQVDRVLAGCPDPAVPAVDYPCPPLAILERAQELEPDVVVLGAADPAAGEFLSGTTLRVAAQCDRPVLVLREPFRWPPRSVLYAAEGPDPSGEGLRRACDWLHRVCPAPSPRSGREPSTELLVLHVEDDATAGPDRAAALARAARGACGPRFRVTGIRDPGHGRPPSAPAEQVLGWAERNGADLVLLHRHEDATIPLRDRTWYRVLLRSRRPVCLLPESGEPDPEPADAGRERDGAPDDEGVLAAST